MASVTELDAVTILDAMEVLTGRPWREDRARAVRTYASGRVDWDSRAREVYSYGRHFPLVRFVPKRLNGAADLFVINGDTWRQTGPSRTGAHQSTVRDGVRRFPGIGTIIIPFSALNGAGIDIDSIRPVHVRPDANWSEVREVRTLAEMPMSERTIRYLVDCESATLDGVPADHRRTWRAGGYQDVEPDADGVYRWKESRTRPAEPDSDGVYRWTVNLHRLGDALFSAVRPVTQWRDARPMESERDNARVSSELADFPDLRRYCGDAPESRHESGPSGACVHCGRPLRVQETRRPRARYLSSFDTNEVPSLYFLAQVPRGAGDSVESALESLAPRAVHAAMARGREVRRQGDIFLIDTNLTREDLAARGATFGRLTQWTRDARARAGEVNYRPKQTAAEHRREVRFARAEWRRRFRESLAGATMPAREPGRHAATRAAWNELRARHARELDAAHAAGIAPTEPESAPCPQCGAEVGAACAGRAHWQRETLARRHETETREMKAASRHRAPSGAPATTRGARPQWRRRRAECAARVETARADLQRALGAPARFTRDTRAYASHYYYGAASSVASESRRRYAESVKRARSELDRALDVAARAESGRVELRDGYRSRYGANALARWNEASQTAAERYRPDEFRFDAITARRERARRQVAIYGTAHTATETARVAGAMYVSGIVRHVPELEPNRRGEPDHAPIPLTAGRWYLAVRNRVPRQRTAGGAR